MGLAICRKIVARHGGSITARSQPGQGSTFIVTLPAAPNSQEATCRTTDSEEVRPALLPFHTAAVVALAEAVAVVLRNRDDGGVGVGGNPLLHGIDSDPHMTRALLRPARRGLWLR